MENRVKITPNNAEVELYTKFFNEAAFAGGTSVKYLPITMRTITTTSSEVFEWGNALDVDIIYDERPKVQLLKRLNWYTEDTTIQPRIMYFPIRQNGKVLTVRRGDLVKVPSGIDGVDDYTFQVSESRADLVPIMFICNVVPFRKNVEVEKDPTINNKWLNV